MNRRALQQPLSFSCDSSPRCARHTHHVLLLEAHLRHVRHEDGPERARDLEVVRRTQWAPAQFGEAEARDGASALRDEQVAPPKAQRAPAHGQVVRVARERLENLVELAPIVVRERKEVHVRQRARHAAVVCVARVGCRAHG